MIVDASLEELGLLPKQARAYRACLELGMTPIMPIVKKTGIPRSSLSYLLENLHKQGFIEIVNKSSRRLYVATSPRTIRTRLKENIEESKKRLATFEAVLPNLNQLLRSTKFQPAIRLFRDAEIRECYTELLENAVDEIWNVGETAKIFEVLGSRFWQRWSEKRAGLKIKAKAIRVQEEAVSPSPAFDNIPLRTLRYAPAGFVSPAHIVICGDQVAIITTSKESFAILISSRDFALTMKSWFQRLWQLSTPK